jgi:hypothetical protein
MDTDVRLYGIPSMTSLLSRRDLAVLTAIREGRCVLSSGPGARLLVDGLSCCHQFVTRRLLRSGLIEAPGAASGPVRLTARGLAALRAA